MDAALFHTICPPHIIHISFAYKQNLCQLKCSKPETKTEMVEKPPRNLFMCGTKQTLADVPHIKRLRGDFSTISVLGSCKVAKIPFLESL